MNEGGEQGPKTKTKQRKIMWWKVVSETNCLLLSQSQNHEMEYKSGNSNMKSWLLNLYYSYILEVNIYLVW